MIGSSRDGLVTTIEIQREDKRNALDHEVLDGLAAAFADAVESGARAVVLTGRGAMFCAGADLSGPVYDPDFLTKLVATLQQIETAPVPVIAATSSALAFRKSGSPVPSVMKSSGAVSRPSSILRSDMMAASEPGGAGFSSSLSSIKR